MTPKPTKEELLAMADKGMNYYSIGLEYGIMPSQVREWFIEYGMVSVWKGIPSISKEELDLLYTTKRMTQKEIGKEFGVSGASISRMLRKLNIPTRTKGASRRAKISYHLTGRSIISSEGE